MKKKIFFISDIHGAYSIMIDSLKEAGYDENNENHLLVVLGDIFDRLDESVKVYEYLKRLTDERKAIVTYGNHHNFLIDFLEGKQSALFNYFHNGLNTTIADFWHRTKPFESWCMLDRGLTNSEIDSLEFFKWQEICRKDILEEYPDLLPWLKSLPRYFESKNIIGTHGALDLHVPDWHFPNTVYHNYLDWDALDFDDGNFINVKNTTGKKIVLGHFSSAHLRKMWKLGDKNDHSILQTLDNKYFIDSCVVLSKKINVLVLEDELLEN